MQEYEVIREMFNLCPGNQMRYIYRRNSTSRPGGFGKLCKGKV